MTQILTFLGRSFDLATPDTDLIDPRDIAHALAHVCRFGGHTRKFYSVAQHSCFVADLVPEEHKLAALLHDATEAYVGDMVRPLKLAMPTYQAIEEQIWLAICKRFWIDSELPACVRDADMIALASERRDLMPHHSAAWLCLEGVEPIAKTIRPWGIQEARDNYFQRLMDQLSIEHRRKAGEVITRKAPSTPTALLRNAIDVAAQKTKSLCCAAAGITDSIRATTEARIPHEKLRGAATTEATLNARVCPPAQLVQGYKHPTEPGDEPQVIGKLIVLDDDLVAFEIVGTPLITEGTEVIRHSDHRAQVTQLQAEAERLKAAFKWESERAALILEALQDSEQQVSDMQSELTKKDELLRMSQRHVTNATLERTIAAALPAAKGGAQ